MDHFMRKDLIDYARSRAPLHVGSFDPTPVRFMRKVARMGLSKRSMRFLKSVQCCVFALAIVILMGGLVVATLLDHPRH